MELTGRLFNCARCHKQVVLCSGCDRGQRYCSQACAVQTRCERQRAANTRYQETRQGRHHHAKRQACYRHRLQEKVTYQGSRVLRHIAQCYQRLSNPGDLQHCHACQRAVSSYLRRDFLHTCVHKPIGPVH